MLREHSTVMLSHIAQNLEPLPLVQTFSILVACSPSQKFKTKFNTPPPPPLPSPPLLKQTKKKNSRFCYFIDL